MQEEFVVMEYSDYWGIFEPYNNYDKMTLKKIIKTLIDNGVIRKYWGFYYEVADIAIFRMIEHHYDDETDKYFDLYEPEYELSEDELYYYEFKGELYNGYEWKNFKSNNPELFIKEVYEYEDPDDLFTVEIDGKAVYSGRPSGFAFCKDNDRNMELFYNMRFSGLFEDIDFLKDCIKCSRPERRLV